MRNLNEIYCFKLVNFEIEVTENRSKKGYTFYFNLKRKVFYRSNYSNFFLYRTNYIYVCTPRKHTVLYSIPRIGSNRKRKSDTQDSTVSLGILNLMLPIIVLIHICLSPINRIGTSRRNGNSPICLMISVKRKRKKGPLLGIKFCNFYFLSQKIKIER